MAQPAPKKARRIVGPSSLWVLALVAGWLTWSQYVGGSGGWLPFGSGPGSPKDDRGAPHTAESGGVRMVAHHPPFGDRGKPYLGDPEAREFIVALVRTAPRDGAPGIPLPARRVGIRTTAAARGDALVIGTTGADGRTRIGVPRSAESALLGGGLRAELLEEKSLSPAVAIPPPASGTHQTTITLEAEPRPVVPLVLKEDGGAPFEGDVLVEMRRSGDASGDSRPDSTSWLVAQSVDGVVSIGGLLPGADLELKIEPQGRAPTVSPLRVPAAEQVRQVEVAVKPGVSVVAGRLTNTDGSPVGGRPIRAAVHRRIDDPSRSAQVDLKSGADGAFSFEVAAGRDILVELRPEPPPGVEDLPPFVFEARRLDGDSTWELGVLKLEPLSVLAAGVVSLADGRPAAGATVLLLPADSQIPSRRVHTGPDGKFQISGPPAIRSFDLFALTDTDAWRNAAPLAAGATEVAATLGPAGAIHGKLAAPPKSPVYAEILAKSGARYSSTRVQPDGSFAFPHVPPGTWSVSLTFASQTLVIDHLEVIAGQQNLDPRLQAVGPVAESAPASR